MRASVAYRNAVFTLGDNALLQWEQSEGELVLRSVVAAPEAYAISQVGETTLVLMPTALRPLIDWALEPPLDRHQSVYAHGACPGQEVVAYYSEQGLCLEGAEGVNCRPVARDRDAELPPSLVCSESGAFHCGTVNVDGEVASLCRRLDTGEELLAETEAPAGSRYAAYVDPTGAIRFRARSAALTWDNPALPGFQHEVGESGPANTYLPYGPRLAADGRVEPTRPYRSSIARAVGRPNALEMVAWIALEGGDVIVTRYGIHYWEGEFHRRLASTNEVLAARRGDAGSIELVAFAGPTAGSRLRHGSWNPESGLTWEVEVSRERAAWAENTFALASMRRGSADTPPGDLTAPFPARVGWPWEDFAQWVLTPQVTAGCARPGYVAELRSASCASSGCALFRIESACVDRVARAPVWSPRGTLAAEAVVMSAEGASQIWWLDARGALRNHQVPSAEAAGLAVYEVDDEHALIDDGSTVYRAQPDETAVTTIGRGIASVEGAWYWESSPGIWRHAAGGWLVVTDEVFANPQGCRGVACGRLIVDGVPARELSSGR